MQYCIGSRDLVKLFWSHLKTVSPTDCVSKLGLKSETGAEVPSSCIISNDQQGQLCWFLKKKKKKKQSMLAATWLHTLYHPGKHFPNEFMVLVTTSTSSSIQQRITYCVVWFRLEQIHDGAGHALGCSYLVIATLPSKPPLRKEPSQFITFDAPPSCPHNVIFGSK